MSCENILRNCLADTVTGITTGWHACAVCNITHVLMCQLSPAKDPHTSAALLTNTGPCFLKHFVHHVNGDRRRQHQWSLAFSCQRVQIGASWVTCKHGSQWVWPLIFTHLYSPRNIIRTTSSTDQEAETNLSLSSIASFQTKLSCPTLHRLEHHIRYVHEHHKLIASLCVKHQHSH